MTLHGQFSAYLLGMRQAPIGPKNLRAICPMMLWDLDVRKPAIAGNEKRSGAIYA